MPTTTQMSEIVQKVRDQLKTAEADGIYLRVSNEKLDDDWLVTAWPARWQPPPDHHRPLGQAGE